MRMPTRETDGKQYRFRKFLVKNIAVTVDKRNTCVPKNFDTLNERGRRNNIVNIVLINDADKNKRINTS